MMELLQWLLLITEVALVLAFFLLFSFIALYAKEVSTPRYRKHRKIVDRNGRPWRGSMSFDE